MLAGGTFTIVVVTNNNPLDTSVTVGGGDLRNTTVRTVELVQNFVGFSVLSVDRTDEAVFCMDMSVNIAPLLQNEYSYERYFRDVLGISTKAHQQRCGQ